LILTLYNEGPSLNQSLAEIYQLLKKSGLSFEIILVDDRGSDNSLALAEEFIKDKDNCSIIRHEINIGRGGSVSDGMRAANGKVVGFVDTDLEISPEKIPEAVQTIISEQADVVTGLRNYKFNLSSIFRYFLTSGYRLMVRLLFSLPISDTETGFKFFNREKILPILEKAKDKRWFWDTEIIVLSHYADLKILEIPVIFKRRFDKKSTVNTLKDSIDYLTKIISFKLRNGKK